jgi:hypothetical protein
MPIWKHVGSKSASGPGSEINDKAWSEKIISNPQLCLYHYVLNFIKRCLLRQLPYYVHCRFSSYESACYQIIAEDKFGKHDTFSRILRHSYVLEEAGGHLGPCGGTELHQGVLQPQKQECHRVESIRIGARLQISGLSPVLWCPLVTCVMDPDWGQVADTVSGLSPVLCWPS